jgi:hypothetical protein
MESKIAGMIGVAALAALGSTEALAAPDPDAALQAKSFAELLQPIPNATALLENAATASAAKRAMESDGVQLAQYYHHHHHHHHHWSPWRRHHHHHHHHHHHYY